MPAGGRRGRGDRSSSGGRLRVQVRWHLARRREAAEAPVGGDPPIQASYMGHYTMPGWYLGHLAGQGIVGGRGGRARRHQRRARRLGNAPDARSALQTTLACSSVPPKARYRGPEGAARVRRRRRRVGGRGRTRAAPPTSPMGSSPATHWTRSVPSALSSSGSAASVVEGAEGHGLRGGARGPVGGPGCSCRLGWRLRGR